MTAFDPYHVWLGIGPEEQPANHYRLLGLRTFESNADAIDHAADRHSAHLKSFAAGERADLAQKLLNEIAAARVCLLDAKAKAEYDAKLRALQPAMWRATLPVTPSPGTPPASPSPTPIPLRTESAPVAVAPQHTVPQSATSQFHTPRTSRRAMQPIIATTVAGVLVIAAVVGFREYQANRNPSPSEPSPLTAGAGKKTTPNGESPNRPRSPAGESASDPLPGGQINDGSDTERRSEYAPFAPLVDPSAEKKVAPNLTPSPANPSDDVPKDDVPPDDVPAVNDPQQEKPTAGDSPDQAASNPSGGDSIEDLLQGEVRPTNPDASTEVPNEAMADDDAPQGAFDPNAAAESLFGDFVRKGGGPRRGIPATIPANRLPVPEDAAVAAKEGEIRKLFARDFANTRPAEIWKFGRHLRGLAAETNDDLGRYALLRLAIERAGKAGDAETARTAADELAMRYAVDWIDVVGGAVLGAVQGGVAIAARPAAIEHAGDLARAAYEGDRLPLAGKLTAEWSKLAAQTRDQSAIADARKLGSRIAQAATNWPDVENALQVLEQMPADEAANATVGRYFAFVKNDWARGLAYLSRGNDAPLRKAAELEGKESPTATALVATGDAWWAAAEAMPAADRRAVQMRAFYAYSRANELLSGGIDKLRVAKRLEELAYAETLPEDAALVLTFESGTLSERGGKTFVADAIARKQSVAVLGAKSTEGRAGKALAFETSEQFLDAGKPAALRAPLELTVCAWIKPAVSGNGPGDIVSKDDWHGPARGFVLRNFKNSHLDFTVGNNDWNSVITPAPLAIGVWQHAAASYDAKEIRLYLDGRLVARKPIARPVVHSPWPLSIGRGTYDKLRGFVGAIDEVAIFARVLGEDEIAELYQAGASGMRLAK
jgi:hypothetical protein